MTDFLTSRTEFNYNLGKKINVSDYDHILCVSPTSISPPSVPLAFLGSLDPMVGIFIPLSPPDDATLNPMAISFILSPSPSPSPASVDNHSVSALPVIWISFW